MLPEPQSNRLLRVSEVIRDSGLGSDFSHIPARILDPAIARGNAVHKAVELIADGDLDRDSVPEHLRGYIAAYDRFVAETHYQPIATEIDLHHPLGFAGRPDSIGWVAGYRYLVDLKTPLVVNPGPLLLQLSAYWQAWPVTFPTEPLRGVGCLQLRPDGKYKWRRHDLSVAWSVFCSALAMLQGRASPAQLAAIDAWASRYPVG